MFCFSSLTLPQTIGQVFIEKLADYILVKTTFGFSLAWDGISGIYLKLSEEHKGKSCGLCANYNGIQSDDFIIQQGEQVEEKKWVGTSEVFFLHWSLCLYTQKGTKLVLGWVKNGSYYLPAYMILSDVWTGKGFCVILEIHELIYIC